MSTYMLDVQLEPHESGQSGKASCGCIVDVDQEQVAHVMLCDGHGDEPHDLLEAGRSAGFVEGQQAERTDAVALVKVLEKVLTILSLADNDDTLVSIAASLDAGGELALRAAKAYLARSA